MLGGFLPQYREETCVSLKENIGWETGLSLSVLTISKMEERLEFLDLQRISVFNVASSHEIFKGNYTMHDCGL